MAATCRFDSHDKAEYTPMGKHDLNVLPQKLQLLKSCYLFHKCLGSMGMNEM